MLLRLTYCLLLSTAALSGCESRTKCDDACPDTPAMQLQNTWTWQQSTGGIAGRTETPASTGRQHQLVFDASGTVRSYVNGQLTQTRTYTIQTGTSIFTNQPADIIIYNGGNGIRQSFRIDGRTLSLSDEVYDGFSSIYQR